jgi:7-keto-8-aminopelargonate synthetase-like enzyme
MAPTKNKSRKNKSGDQKITQICNALVEPQIAESQQPLQEAKEDKAAEEESLGGQGGQSGEEMTLRDFENKSASLFGAEASVFLSKSVYFSCYICLYN